MSERDLPRQILGPLATEPTPVEAERIRIRHHLDQLRAHVGALEITLKESEDGCPPGPEAGQALTQVATTISVAFGRLDAYMRSAPRSNARWLKP